MRRSGRKTLLILVLVMLLGGALAYGIYRWMQPPLGSWGELAPRAETTSVAQIEDFDFAVVADLHFGFEGDEDADRVLDAVPRLDGAPLPEGKRHAAPEFLLNCGDNIENGDESDAAEETARYLAGLERIGVPCFYANGNHDVAGEKDMPRQQRREPWSKGELYYDFERHGVHFIVLNYYADDEGDYPDVVLGNKQRYWLWERLLEIGLSKPIVVVMHPLPRRWDWLKMPDWIAMEPRAEEFLADTLRGFNIAAIFCGHYHGHHVEEWGGIPVICVGSWKHRNPYVIGAQVREEQLTLYRFRHDDLLGSPQKAGVELLKVPLRHEGTPLD